MYLVTGATGFVGANIAQALLASGESISCAVRLMPSELTFNEAGVRWHVVGDINSGTEWQSALQGVQTVVHCAARAHVLQEKAIDPIAAYRKVNTEGTYRLAQQCAAAGVKRFVFLSSIGVNGNQTSVPFTEAHLPNPCDAYAVSKLEAEQVLLNLADQTGMEVVIIRPPLVYGPGASGNFAILVNWMLRGLPLPLGSVHNQRSLIAVDNLVSLVLLCADRARTPQVVNQVFLVADGEDVSTSTLLRKVARAAGQPNRLLSVSPSLLLKSAHLLGKRSVADRLLGNLQVDASKARTLIGWRPVVTIDEQLAKMFKVRN